MQTSQIRKANTIKCVEDRDGRGVTEQDAIGEVFTGFFSSLFTTSFPTKIKECLHALDTRISVKMKDCLMKPFTQEEVTTAVFQMNPSGSPGPYGFLAQFYQNHWQAVGEEVCRFALQALNQGGSLKEVDDTFISLIPKVRNPKRVAEYRPISLCNVLYKIVSKTLANRLKGILPT